MKHIVFSVFFLFFITSAYAAEQPPYSVENSAAMEDFNEIYRQMSQHRHNADDGTQIITSSSLPDSSVTAGSYTNADITVNEKGIITSAANGSAGSVANSSDTWTAVQRYERSLIMSATTFVVERGSINLIPSTLNRFSLVQKNGLTHNLSISSDAHIVIDQGGAADTYRGQLFTLMGGNVSGIGVGVDGEGQLAFRDSAESNKRMYMGFDDTNNVGYIAVSDPGTAWLNLQIGSAGGTFVGIGKNNPTVAMDINGTLAKTAGTFKIPHPVKEDKYLLHSFVEAPEFLLIYRGTGQLSSGEVTITLPDYFTALVASRTGDITANFTCVGGYSDLYLENYITSDQFTVRTVPQGNQSQRFHWTVYARRADPWVMAPNNEMTDGEGHFMVEQDVNVTSGMLKTELEAAGQSEVTEEIRRNAMLRERQGYKGYPKYDLPPIISNDQNR